MTDLLPRLKQRKIVQWAVAYLAGAWVLLQVLGLATESYGWPRLVMQLSFGCIAFGFAIALVLAWYHGERGAQKISGTELLILALLLAIGGGLLWKFARNAPSPAAVAAPARPESASVPAAAAAAASDSKSIAVLPFVNMSGDPNNDYFSDGITEEILDALAQIPDLKVAARTSAFAFKGKDLDLRKVGEILDVATVLEGSVQRAGDEVRITAQLIDTRTGYHLWSEKYDRKLTSIFAVEDEISKAIATKLQLQLGGTHTGISGNTGNPQAHELYLRGLTLLAARGPSLRDAADAFEQAVKLDPGYAQAWGALAETDALLPWYRLDSIEAGSARAEAAAQRALTIDPGSASAYVALGLVDGYRCRWQDANQAFRRALQLAPGDFEAVNQYAQFLLTTGQFAEALREIDRAHQLDPVSPVVGAVRAAMLLTLHRDDEATTQIESVLSSHPNLGVARSIAVTIYTDRHRFTEAETQLRAWAKLDGVDADAKALLARGMADPAQRAAALHGLESAPANADLRDDPVYHALFLMRLGENDRALDQLDIYAAKRNSPYPALLWDRTFDPLRNNPRFVAVLKKIGLPYRPASDTP